MKVLVCHDRDEVAESLKGIALASGIEGISVEIAADGTSCRRALSHSVYDLLVLDLTLPHIKGVDNPNYETADRLLQELFRLNDLNIPGDIIGLTLDPDALARINNAFGSHVMAIIAEDSSGIWKQQIKDKLLYVYRASRSRQTSINTHYDYDCLVVTALDKELNAFREFVDLSPLEKVPGAYSFSFSDRASMPRRAIGFSIGRSGEARAASFTQSLISMFRPKVALMAGICGGVRGKVELGDVIIAESAIDWDYGKWADPNRSDVIAGSAEEPTVPLFLSRPDPISISDSKAHRVARNLLLSDFLETPAFLRQVSRLSEGRIKSPKAHLVPMASGSAVIASDEILARVRNLNESIRGVDMECFGFYHAATKTHVIKPETLCLKSVSDFSNGTKNDEYHEGCTFVSASLVTHILTSIWEF